MIVVLSRWCDLIEMKDLLEDSGKTSLKVL